MTYRNKQVGFLRKGSCLRGQSACQLLRRLMEIPFTDDIIPIGDKVGFMSTYLHGYPFGDSSPDHLPYCRPSEVVRNLTRESGFLASPMPPLVVAHDPLSVVVENEGNNLTDFSL